MDDLKNMKCVSYPTELFGGPDNITRANHAAFRAMPGAVVREEQRDFSGPLVGHSKGEAVYLPSAIAEVVLHDIQHKYPLVNDVAEREFERLERLA